MAAATTTAAAAVAAAAPSILRVLCYMNVIMLVLVVIDNTRVSLIGIVA